MSALNQKLDRLRRRIRIGRSAAAAARGAFYASLAACAVLAATRIAGLEAPASVAWGAIAAIALAVAMREAARSFTRRECAVHLDRLLGLDERLSTAVEMAGPMREAQVADAEAALERAVLPARRLPREAKLLAGSALLMGGILLVHAPASAGGTEDPARMAVTEEVARQLEAAAPDRVEFAEVRALLKQGRLEEAAAKLQTIRDLLDQKLLQEGRGGAQTQRERDAAAAGASALSAELARMGKPLRATPPTVAAIKLERQTLGAPTGSAELSADAEVARYVATVLERADWAPRYDAVIRRYYGSEPR